MLHVVNGDSFAAKLNGSGIPGSILVWRESLYEGPISIDVSEAYMRWSKAHNGLLGVGKNRWRKGVAIRFETC